MDVLVNVTLPPLNYFFSYSWGVLNSVEIMTPILANGNLRLNILYLTIDNFFCYNTLSANAWVYIFSSVYYILTYVALLIPIKLCK